MRAAHLLAILLYSTNALIAPRRRASPRTVVKAGSEEDWAPARKAVTVVAAAGAAETAYAAARHYRFRRKLDEPSAVTTARRAPRHGSRYLTFQKLTALPNVFCNAGCGSVLESPYASVRRACF